ncbi:FusB/FusC family EF-G-binding protein [Lactococcus termiticola]|uniref:Fibronectin-binding protein n=1 Tax=Lactococcus termiticola TaxID=2169526 RepID=A0A2R5HEP9_9LACT|nr:FusB/FusC family EF-G-binding protein [Lactococcus termiticola]GBG96512.1 fibronectin-binding protein [Lactococcus termiticola]
MLKNHEFNRIKHLTFDMVNAYHSVNDKDTLAAVYAQVVAEIEGLTDELADFIEAIGDQKLSTEQAERLLEGLKPMVEAFEMPGNMAKLFKKVKKLKVPDMEMTDLKAYSFYAWNDIASGRKYIVTGDGQGYWGTISGQTQNICSICQKTSAVTQFLAVTKSGADGTYTKQGNYICLDSEQCNRQIQQLEGLNGFLESIRPK